MAKILERTPNASVAPRRIFLSHAHYEVPSQQRLRRDDRRQITQGGPPEPVGAHREPAAVIVSKPQAPSTELPPEEAILFDQIGERLSFPAIQPTGDAEEQDPKHRHVDHKRELISDAQ